MTVIVLNTNSSTPHGRASCLYVSDISAKPSDKQTFQLICFTASKQASKQQASTQKA